MHSSKRGTDVKNRLLDSVGEGQGGMIFENSIETWILSCEIDRQFRFNASSRALKASALGQPRGMGWVREVGEGSGRRGQMCTHG